MQEEQFSSKKQQRLNKIKENIQEAGFGELAENMIVEPKDAPKMSKILQEFVSPYIDPVYTLKQRKSLFGLAAIAWNAAVMPTSEIDTFLEKELSKQDTETQQEVKKLIDELIARKYKYFSDIKYFIMDVQVTETKRQYHISVASTLLSNPE
ncbi:hypothetical protein H6G06_17170 [Anabaena sphaerica FACHB-251]|uniref:Uncharacterized protein n=1 Tax=Anabaena sphaerica FACHB-251 TaxID=2692883 RepID=A0A926WIE6_9NOST|nr:hypothetical protein [Anabaena sphaerica]MBD2295164.1 hypothetical protein [Anabaena sphaerica FACHB-251]